MAEGAGHPVREPRLSEKPQFDPDRWKAISHLLDVALELPDAERRAWLDRFDPRDAASRDVIEELLEAYSRAEAAGFLASPVTLDGVPLPGAFAAFRQGIEIGPLSARPGDRPRRHGNRVACRAGRRAVRAPRGGEVPEHRADRAHRPGAVQARGAHSGVSSTRTSPSCWTRA